MMTYAICYSILQKKNNTKHDKSKKHKYFSNLILNSYFVKDVKLDDFKNVMFKYYFDHMKKFNNFTVRVYLKIKDEIQFNLSVPLIVSYGTIAITMSVTMEESAREIQDRAIKA